MYRPRPQPRKKTAFIFLVLVWVAPLQAGAPKEVAVRWEELAPLVEKREIETVLTNGVHVRGRAEKVLPEALEVRVKKTSDAAVIPKGRTRIARELVTVLTVRWKGSLLRYMLAPAMGMGGPILFGSAGLIGEANPVAVYGLLTVFAIAGYFVGDWLDTREMRLVLVPQRPVEAPAKGEESPGGVEFEGGIPYIK